MIKKYLEQPGMISEGLCDTEDWSNGCFVRHRNKLQLIKIDLQ